MVFTLCISLQYGGCGGWSHAYLTRGHVLSKFTDLIKVLIKLTQLFRVYTVRGTNVVGLI